MQHSPGSAGSVYKNDERRALEDFPGDRVQLLDASDLFLAGYSWQSSSPENHTRWHWIDAWYKTDASPLAPGYLWLRTWSPDEAVAGEPGLQSLKLRHLADVVIAEAPVELDENSTDEDILAGPARVRSAIDAAAGTDGWPSRFSFGQFEVEGGVIGSVVWSLVRRRDSERDLPTVGLVPTGA